MSEDNLLSILSKGTAGLACIFHLRPFSLRDDEVRLTKGFIHHLNPVSKGIYWQRVVIHYLLSNKSCKSGQRGNPAPVLMGRGSDSACGPGAKARLLQLAASRSGWVSAQPPPVTSFLSLEFMMLVLVLMHKTPESNLLCDHGDKENFGKIKQK